MVIKQIVSYLYMAALSGLSIYALHTALLITLYLWHCNDDVPPTPNLAAEVWPVVTVQVPLRNERYVVQRILRSVAALEWPRECLEIQVLDDSTDQTTALAQQEAARLRAQGVDIRVYHRPDATGNAVRLLWMQGVQSQQGHSQTLHQILILRMAGLSAPAPAASPPARPAPGPPASPGR